MNVGIISLGCAKNLVDSEMILGLFDDQNFHIVNEPIKADIIIVNTCGFLESSKKESIEAIIEMTKYNKRLVVVGCLVERYLKELQKELPEVTAFIPIRDYPRIKEILNDLLRTEYLKESLSFTRRILATPFFSAYLKISEGCDNRCTYCAIPLIRGGFVSRRKEDIIQEAVFLANKEIKELVVISQDTTRYGMDLKSKTTITELLKELLVIEQFAFIRLLYLYPDEISDDLLYLIAKEKRLTPYFDIPIQHASSTVLGRMNRRGDKEFLKNLFTKIRTIIPNAILRTTIIVGFPGETEEEFAEMVEFIKDIKFNHLGAFMYSHEEGTPSYHFRPQISQKEKESRYNVIMREQRKISYQLNRARIGTIEEGIIISFDKRRNTYLLRSGFNAPDNIDGNISFTSLIPLKVGEIVKVKITDAFVYDLHGIYYQQ